MERKRHTWLDTKVQSGDEGDWISISDLMSGLMLVFLFIAIMYMFAQQKARKRIETRKNQLLALSQKLEGQKGKLERERLAVRKIAVTFRNLQNALFQKLYAMFGAEQILGNLTIKKNNLSISFHAPPKSRSFFFKQASCGLPRAFKKKLRWFFPRYLEILYLPQFRHQIEELRIEGHTSSEGGYLSNMTLSQCRARTVARYLLRNTKLSKEQKRWLKKLISVTGLSSSHTLRKPSCYSSAKRCEDRRRSRRVTFRIKTAAEQKIVKILEALRHEVN